MKRFVILNILLSALFSHTTAGESHPTIASGLNKCWKFSYTLTRADGSTSKECLSYTIGKDSLLEIYDEQNEKHDKVLYTNIDVRNTFAPGHAYSIPYLQRRGEIFIYGRGWNDLLLMNTDLEIGQSFERTFAGSCMVSRKGIFDEYLPCVITPGATPQMTEIELNGTKEIWIDGIGSVTQGIAYNIFEDLVANSKGEVLRISDLQLNVDSDNLSATFPTDTNEYILQHFSTEDTDFTSEEEYDAFQEEPIGIACSFSDDTLCIKGKLNLSSSHFIQCAISGDNLTVGINKYLSSNYTDNWSYKKVDVKIPGFKRGNYNISCWGRTYQLSCGGNESDIAPFLQGNPIWVFKYEHLPQAYQYPDNSWIEKGCWIDTGNRHFTYYFLGKQKEIDGKTYTMMGEIESRSENQLSVLRWVPVREEDGLVYAITDSLPGWGNDHIYMDGYNPVPYTQQGNECILYNFNLQLGDKVPGRNGENIEVNSCGTCQLLDGSMRRVFVFNYLELIESLGYIDDMHEGITNPLCEWPIATNGHMYSRRLNAYFNEGEILFKSSKAPEGISLNDTIWSEEVAWEYAKSYKADPRQEEVFAYIKSLQIQNTTGMPDVPSPQSPRPSPLHDLQGRQLQHEPARGVFIKDGRKWVK